MITESSIYWILKLDDIRGLFIAATAIFAVITFASVLVWGITFSEESRFSALCKKFCLTVSAVLAISAFALAFIPSTKQMAMIKVLPAIANSEIVGERSADA